MTVVRSHRRARLGAVLALVLGAGCVTSRSALTEVLPVQTELGTFQLEYPAREATGATMARIALEKASPRLARWGRLEQPVTVRIHPDHRSLEKAAKRSGYEWLRAWARYDVLDVQAPDSWRPVYGTQEDLLSR